MTEVRTNERTNEHTNGRTERRKLCERRIEVFVKIQKKNFWGGGGGVGGGGWGVGGGVRVDVNEELKFL